MARALQGWGIFLTDCQITERSVKAGILAIDPDDPPPNPVEVFDVDTDEPYRVSLPEITKPVCYSVELDRVAV